MSIQMMYVANIRLPTEKAHGYQIMKTCEAVSANGIVTTLVVTDRKTSGLKDLWGTYGIAVPFGFQRIHVVDALSFFPLFLSVPMFLLERWSFVHHLRAWIRVHGLPSCFYTRDPYIALKLKRWFRRVPIIIELHTLPRPNQLRQLSDMSGFVCVTRWLEKSVCEVLPSASTCFVPDAVDLDCFDVPESRLEARRRLHIPEDKTIVMYGGRFSTLGEGKGLSELDEAVRDASRMNPDCQLYLIGGDAKEFERIEGRAPGAATVCISAVSREDLAMYYRAADILVMPFPWTVHYAYEMSPLKLFEYMASGTPIISSDLPSLRDVLDESACAFYDPKQPGALASVLARVLSEPVEGRQRRAEIARERVNGYTWKDRAKKITSFIESAC